MQLYPVSHSVREIFVHCALIHKPLMPLSIKHVYVNWYIFSKTHSRTISRRPACEIVKLYYGAMSKEILIQYKIFIVKNVHFSETWIGF